MGKSRERRFRQVAFSPTGLEQRCDEEDDPDEEPAAELLEKVRASNREWPPAGRVRHDPGLGPRHRSAQRGPTR